MIEGIIIPLSNGSVCSGWCDKDDPNQSDCGDYLLVEVDGNEEFYVETADLAAMKVIQLRQELNNFIYALQKAVGQNHG